MRERTYLLVGGNPIWPVRHANASMDDNSRQIRFTSTIDYRLVVVSLGTRSRNLDRHTKPVILVILPGQVISSHRRCIFILLPNVYLLSNRSFWSVSINDQSRLSKFPCSFSIIFWTYNYCAVINKQYSSTAQSWGFGFVFLKNFCSCWIVEARHVCWLCGCHGDAWYSSCTDGWWWKKNSRRMGVYFSYQTYKDIPWLTLVSLSLLS